jgi:hypothetical protein
MLVSFTSNVVQLSYLLLSDCCIVKLDINPSISYYMSYSNQGSSLKTAFAPIIIL